MFGRWTGAASADFLADVSVPRCKGAAITNFLAGVSVARRKGAATANFLAGVMLLAGVAVMADIFMIVGRLCNYVKYMLFWAPF